MFNRETFWFGMARDDGREGTRSLLGRWTQVPRTFHRQRHGLKTITSTQQRVMATTEIDITPGRSRRITPGVELLGVGKEYDLGSYGRDTQ